MSIIKVNKSKDYTIMSNTHFREKNMTLKAKGLLSLMLSLPDNWDYSIAGLVSICVEKESAIISTLKELKQFGYLKVDKLMPNETSSGRIEYVYNIFETPQDIEKQDIENLSLEIQGVENQTQLNTNIYNTKELNTNNIIKKKSIQKKKCDFEELINEYDFDIEVKNVIFEFIELQKELRPKKPYTELSLKKMLNKLLTLSKDSKEQIAILNEAIEMRWLTVFPLRNNNYSRQYQPQMPSFARQIDVSKYDREE